MSSETKEGPQLPEPQVETRRKKSDRSKDSDILKVDLEKLPVLSRLCYLEDLKSFSELWMKTYFADKYPSSSALLHNTHFTYTVELPMKAPSLSEATEKSKLEEQMVIRLCAILYKCQMKPPTKILLSLYGREAGGSVVSRFGEEITHAAAIVCNAATEITVDGKSIVLHHPNNLLSISSEIKRYATETTMSGRSVVTQHPSPSIKKNNTVLKYPTYRIVQIPGKKPARITDIHSIIKPRTYLSLVAWLGWEDDPVESQQEIDELQRLESMKDEVERLKQEVDETSDADDDG